MPLRSIAFLLYFFGSSGAALAYPMAGVLCYVLLYHVFPQTTWWGQAINFMSIRYSFVCGLMLLIGVVLNAGRLKVGKRLMHPLEWGVLMVLLTMLMSGLTGTGWDARTTLVLDKMVKVFLFALMLSHVVVTRKNTWQLVIMLVLMSLYLGHEAKIAPRGSFENNRLDGLGGPDFRESAGLAIHLFALLPFVAVAFRQKQVWIKVLAFFAACYSLNAILLCRARSAFLAGMVAGLMAIWYAPRRHRRWIIVVLVCGTLGGIQLSDSWFWERMVTIFSSAEERDQSAASRLIIWAGAREMVRQNPFGVGVGHFEFEIQKYASEEITQRRDAHNTYVLCLAETGWPGLIVYAGVIATAWITLARLDRKVRRELAENDLLRLLIFANRLALLVYLVAGLFVSRYYTEGMWWLVILPVCLTRAAENEARAEARAELELRAEIAEWAEEDDLLPGPAGWRPLPQ